MERSPPRRPPGAAGRSTDDQSREGNIGPNERVVSLPLGGGCG